MYITGGRMKWYTNEEVILMIKQLGMMHVLYFALKAYYNNDIISGYCLRNNKTLVDVLISPMRNNYNEFIRALDSWEQQYKEHIKGKNNG